MIDDLIGGVLCECCASFFRLFRDDSAGSDGADKPKTALQRDQERLQRQIAERKARKTR